MLINSLKCPTVKKKEKILKIVEFIWIITHNSQHRMLLNVTMIKGKCKIKQKRSKQKDESRLISKKTQMPFKGYLRYKTILCHKVALDVQLINFFI